MRPRRGVTFAASPVFLSQRWGDNFRDLMCSDATTYGNEGKENYFASNETFCVSILDSFVSCGRKKKKFVRLPSSRNSDKGEFTFKNEASIEKRRSETDEPGRSRAPPHWYSRKGERGKGIIRCVRASDSP